jgi:hypothetical protein
MKLLVHFAEFKNSEKNYYSKQQPVSQIPSNTVQHFIFSNLNKTLYLRKCSDKY